ncbi:MAG: hypothetical protein MI700_08940 [Balneolales bacterium]|nr:hypothetical protein [Balneolales bacterium]
MSKLYSVVPFFLIVATGLIMIFTIAYVLYLVLAFFGVIEAFTNLSAPNSYDEFGFLVLGISISKLFLLITLGLLLNILFKIRQNQPFEKLTIRRFYLLGLLVFLMPFAETIPILIIDSLGFFTAEIIGINSIINSISSALILGIIMLSFACIMTLGFKVSEEQKLTV